MQGLEILKNNLPFWDNLSEQEKKAIQSNIFFKSYKKGDIIHSNGDECIGMIIIIKGELRTYIMSEEGKEVTLYRLFESNVCALSADCLLNTITFDTHIEAATDSEIVIIGLPVLSKLLRENIYVENFTYKLISNRFSEAMWSIEQILFMGFDRRLAIFLLDESIKNDSNTIKLTHEEIAKYMGSAREVVSRMLKYFQNEGYIEASRGNIRIKDIDKLRDLL